MDSEYEQSEEEFDLEEGDPEEFAPSKRKTTKNEQIYGDFVEAYDPEPAYTFNRPSDSYGQFKAGSTIESYSSEIEVTMPLKSKPKQAKKIIKEDEDEEDRPMLGQFSLNSFLNQLGRDQLDDIAEEQNQDSSNLLPEGLNDKIINHLQLVKIGEEETQEPINVEHLTFERYMKMGKPAPPPPKYKTEEEKELAKSYKQGYGVGFKMLEKMGFSNITKGLGKNETGIHKPVEAQHKTAFTMKDTAHSKEVKTGNKSESEGDEQEEIKEESIPEKLFGYRSKSLKINNFLLDLQKDYQRLNSQIYFLENEVTSMKNKLQINLSSQFQEQKETDDLKQQIKKLQTLASNIDRCVEHPHLGQHYQIDILFVKKVYDKFRNNDLQYMYSNAEKEILHLKSALNKFYLAKSKESIKMFQQTTAIEAKMNKNIRKKKNKQTNVINLDHPSDEEVEVLTIGVDEEQKIKKFIDLLINKALLPHVDRVLSQSDSLEKVKDIQIIDLINVVKKFDLKQSIIKKLLQERIIPLYQNYIAQLNLSDLESQKVKCLPHMVILPWLHILKIHPNFNFMTLFKTLMRKLWTMQNSVLYNIVKPLMQFSSSKEKSYFVNLYLAPRILHQLEYFSLNNPNSALLNEFMNFSKFLTPEIKEELLESTLFIEVEQVYAKYIQEKEKKDVIKWIKKWRSFSDKISPGKFLSYFEGKVLIE